MKILIYSPYLNILGGGEQYIFNFADCFREEHQVFLVWKDHRLLSQVASRFHLDTSKIILLPYFPPRIAQRKFEVIFFVSDGSIPFLPFGKSILLFMSPFPSSNGKSLTNQLKLKLINHVVCFSRYTKSFIDQEFRTNSDLIYPAITIRPQKIAKRNIILSVGRFTQTLHHKRQDALIDAFIDLETRLPGWQLILAGGTEQGSQTLLTKLKHKISGHNISLQTDISETSLNRLYAQAKIYWHATGFGADLDHQPQKAEHFGISVVEAMGQGTIPLVFNAGGPKEILTNLSGKTWNNLEELREQTWQIAKNNNLRLNLSINAKARAQFFSKKTFCQKFHELVEK